MHHQPHTCPSSLSNPETDLPPQGSILGRLVFPTAGTQHSQAWATDQALTPPLRPSFARTCGTAGFYTFCPSASLLSSGILGNV